MGKVKVTLKKSTIGVTPSQRATVRSLGLRKIGSSRVHEDSAVFRGMVAKTAHLLEVENA